MCFLSGSVQFHQYWSQLTRTSNGNSTPLLHLQLCTCSTLLLFLSLPKWIPSFCSLSSPFQCQFLFKSIFQQTWREYIPIFQSNYSMLEEDSKDYMCQSQQAVLQSSTDSKASVTTPGRPWSWENTLPHMLGVCAEHWNVETTTAEKWRSGASSKRLLLLHVHQKLGFDLWLIFEPSRGHIQTNMTYIYLLFDPRAKVTFTQMCHLSVCFIFITPLMSLKLFYFPHMSHKLIAHLFSVSQKLLAHWLGNCLVFPSFAILYKCLMS